jgi:hypothetical protein
MARRTWVLDTETKGTGAEMVPLDKVLARRRSARAGARASERRRARPQPKPTAEPVEAGTPRRPRRFKVVDVMTRGVLAEGEGLRRTLEILAGTRSVVDVIVYVWDRGEEDWRPLTMREQKLLWNERDARRPAA